MNTKEYYVDEILKFAFLLKQDFEKDKRERAEFRERIKVMTPSWSKQVSAVLPKEEEVKKYKGKTIRRRADGRWWVRYYDSNKVQRSIYGKTQNECLQKLKDALKAESTGEKISNSITLGEWIEKWLQLYKIGKVRGTTVDKFRSLLKNLENFIDKPISKISAMELQAFFNGIEYPRKREQLHTMLKDAFSRAYNHKIIKDNPFDIVEIAKQKRKKKKRPLTHEEEARFVEACKTDPHGDLYLFCMYQGLRIGEAMALDVEDIDFEKRTLTVWKAENAKHEITDPKTESSIRIIPLFQRAIDIMPKKTNGRLFTAYKRGTYQNYMNKLCKRLEIKDISIHNLRHTFSTRCKEAGVDPLVVQKWMGHSNVDMTLNVYTHVDADFEQKMTTKFDTFFDTYSS